MPTPLEDKFILHWRAASYPDSEGIQTFVLKARAQSAPWADFVADKLIVSDYLEPPFPYWVITPRGRDILATADAIGYDPSLVDADCPACEGKGEVANPAGFEVSSIEMRCNGELQHHDSVAYFFASEGPHVLTANFVGSACTVEWQIALRGSGTIELTQSGNVTSTSLLRLHDDTHVHRLATHHPGGTVQLHARLLPIKCSTCSGSGRTTPPVEPAPCPRCNGTREVPLIGSFMEACPACTEAVRREPDQGWSFIVADYESREVGNHAPRITAVRYRTATGQSPDTSEHMLETGSTQTLVRRFVVARYESRAESEAALSFRVGKGTITTAGSKPYVLGGQIQRTKVQGELIAPRKVDLNPPGYGED